MKKIIAPCLLAIALAAGPSAYAVPVTQTSVRDSASAGASGVTARPHERAAGDAEDTHKPAPADMPEPSRAWLIMFIVAAFGGLWLSRRWQACRDQKAGVKTDD